MLDKIKGPADLQKLSTYELENLPEEIRNFLIDNLSKTGGHLGPNLGVVELTIALHYSFNSPVDKLFFDVGHQGYVHKILTNRQDQFKNLRQINGLSGFLKRSESEHDIWEAGHSSTSISAATGFAIVNQQLNQENHSIAIIGDGALTNGMALEALNHVSDLQIPIIIVINDNGMSISKNIGFIDSILKSLSGKNQYQTTKNKIKNKLNTKPVGHSLTEVISAGKWKVKTVIENEYENFFNLMGFDYIGLIDGHNIVDLNNAFEKAKENTKPIILHVKTVKGKGYKYSEASQSHSISPFNIQTGEVKKKSNNHTYSSLIAQLLIDKMQTDHRVYAITPAMIEGSKLEYLERNFPNRFTDVGIAEEHAVTLTASLALAKQKPFLSIYSTFFQRGYDQMFHDVVRQNANVVIGVDRAGLVGEDGETHQGIYDISFLSHMPNVVIVQGNEVSNIKGLFNFAFEHQGPVVIRYPRGGSFTSEQLQIPSTEIKLGTWRYISKPKAKLSIIAYGEMYNKLIEVVKDINDSNINLINALFIKPLDTKCLMEIKDQDILVVEEHTHQGGLISLINEYYNSQRIGKVIHYQNLGTQFIEQGSIEEVYQKHNLDNLSLKNKILSIIEKSL